MHRWSSSGPPEPLPPSPTHSPEAVLTSAEPAGPVEGGGETEAEAEGTGEAAAEVAATGEGAAEAVPDMATPTDTNGVPEASGRGVGTGSGFGLAASGAGGTAAPGPSSAGSRTKAVIVPATAAAATVHFVEPKRAAASFIPPSFAPPALIPPALIPPSFPAAASCAAPCPPAEAKKEPGLHSRIPAGSSAPRLLLTCRRSRSARAQSGHARRWWRRSRVTRVAGRRSAAASRPP